MADLAIAEDAAGYPDWCWHGPLDAEPQRYIRQDIADGLYAALQSMLPNTFTGPYNEAREIEHWQHEKQAGNERAETVLAAFAALRRARG